MPSRFIIAWPADTLGTFHGSAKQRSQQARYGLSRPQGADIHSDGTGNGGSTSTVNRVWEKLPFRDQPTHIHGSMQRDLSRREVPKVRIDHGCLILRRTHPELSRHARLMQYGGASPRSLFERDFCLTHISVALIGGPYLVLSKVADFWTGLLQAYNPGANHLSIRLPSVVSAHLDL